MEQEVLLPLFWLLLAVFLSHLIMLLFRRIQIPHVLLYLLLGMILAAVSGNVFEGDKTRWLDHLSQFGLYYLMFLSGMEIDLNLLRLRKKDNLHKSTLIIGLGVFLLSLFLALMIGLRIHHMDPTIASWMIMLILLTTSLGIVMPILKEGGLLRSSYGQLLLTIAILADLITMLVLSILAGSYPSGLSWRQFLVGLLFPLAVLIFQIITQLRRTSVWKEKLSTNPSFLLQGLFALLGLFGVLTDMAGSEIMLGSFMAGILLSGFRINEKHPFRLIIEGMGYGFFIPIFFVMVGYRFDITSFLRNPSGWIWVPILLSTAYVVKLLPMLIIGPLIGLRNALAGGFLLSSRLTLIVVAASIGERIGAISKDIQDAIMVVAIITSILSPLIFTLTLEKPTKVH